MSIPNTPDPSKAIIRLLKTRPQLDPFKHLIVTRPYACVIENILLDVQLNFPTFSFLSIPPCIAQMRFRDFISRSGICRMTKMKMKMKPSKMLNPLSSVFAAKQELRLKSTKIKYGKRCI